MTGCPVGLLRCNMRLLSFWMVVVASSGLHCDGIIQSFLCSDNVRLTYTLAYSIPTLKEWGLTKTECFDRLYKFSDFAQSIVYCPAHHFCGTNITVNFLNSFPSVTKSDMRECNVYATSIWGCEEIEKLIQDSEVNECAKLMQGCGPCENFVGGYWCNCVTGFQPDFAEQNCLDVDECLEDPCDINGYCENNVGSFECFCNQGYQGNGFNCSDFDECVLSESCHWRAHCTNHPGTHSCACFAGFEGDQCVDLDECELGQDNCNPNNSFCLNTDGSFDCSCMAGFFKNDLGSCDEQNECLLPENSCPRNSDCLDLVGDYGCRCHEGWKGNKLGCVDIDECFELEDNPCGEQAKCNNSVFPYECKCFEGFGPEQPCPDIDECQLEMCHPSADCTNSRGSFMCDCAIGYVELGDPEDPPENKKCEPPPYFFDEVKYRNRELERGVHITTLQPTAEDSSEGLHLLHFYTLPPLTDDKYFVRLQVYTGTYHYRRLIRSWPTKRYWSNTFDVFLIVPFGEEIEDNLELENNRTDLFQLRNGQSDFYACSADCSLSSYLLKVCDLGYYMSLFTGADSKCTSDMEGVVTSLQFYNTP
ncbi:fibulin-5-like [Symsagittifera roscoffensis]|uniref:fibulin-5-like n=1 Tax=Symsagittifera roscoffensis TaxID=84072 RepID=UPI00307B72C5